MLSMREGNAALVAGRTPAADTRAATVLQAAEDAAMLNGDTLAGGAALPWTPALLLALPTADVDEPASDLDLL